MVPALINGYKINHPGDAYSKVIGTDIHGGDPAIGMLRALALAYGPSAYQNAAFSNALQPGQEANTLREIQDLSPGNAFQNAQAIRQQGQGQAADEGSQLASQLMASGAGIGAKQGSMVMAANGANRNANNYLTDAYSPQGISQRMQALAQIYGGVQNNPSMNMIAGTAGPIGNWTAQQHQMDQQGGLLGQIGGIASTLSGIGGFGGGIGKMLGGGAPLTGGAPSNPQLGTLNGNAGFGSGFGSGSVNGFAMQPSAMGAPQPAVKKPGGQAPSFTGGTHYHVYAPLPHPGGMPTSGAGGW